MTDRVSRRSRSSDFDLDITSVPTMTVVEDDRSGMVTYRGDKGTRFRVLIRQKANPIGFMAKLHRPKSKVKR